MKLLLLSLFFLFSLASFADDMKVELSPTKPVVGEVFQVIFRVFSDSDEEPIVNFSPNKVEVVGKSNFGVKTTSTYINGQFKTSRELTIVYDLAASEPGHASLRDITVSLGSKSIRHPTLSFNVLKEPEVAADVFVMAEVPKKSIYLGEGIVVRYFLYSKLPVNNLDIKKYPKLNHFLKRFLQEPDRSERVTVDGEIYSRIQIYAAKLFPEKSGELKIDPLHLSVVALMPNRADPLGGFGIGGTSRTKSLSSEAVVVEVKPLPDIGKPANFTGLVGKHEFDLKANASRLIVNEPLEIKLTVTGGGALENMEAPAIVSHPNLEEFESNGDLKIMNADQATKVFEYTFLPKANLEIPASTVTLSYFDPDSARYVPVQLPLSEILVAGGNVTASKEKKTEIPHDKDETPVSKVPSESKLEKPLFDSVKSWKKSLNYVNVFLSLLAIIIAFSVIVKKEKLPSLTKSSIPSDFKKGNFKLSEFARWMSPLISKSGKSPLALIKDSNLKPETKTYFIDLLNSNDYKDYSYSKGDFKFTYRATSFKELDKYIQSFKDEDTSQST